MTQRYFARSASDHTDDWPFWFVADRQKGGLNVTPAVAAALGHDWPHGAVLTDRESARELADSGNALVGISREKAG
jgi:hypothetical protein